MRVGLTTATEAKLKIKNGEYEVEGYGSEAYLEFINISNRLFSNNTFHLTKHREENFQRLATNQSDFLSSFVSFGPNYGSYDVPVPMFTTRMGFMTGYNMIEKSPETKECAHVFCNFTLLSPGIYVSSILLILAMVQAVLIRTLLRVYYPKNFFYTSGKKRAHYQIELFRKCFLRDLSRIYYGNSKKFRLISFTFVLLSFYLVKSFGILYKTSYIIVQEPYVIRNYQDLLSDERAVPGFYDVVANVSQRFKDAPSDSLRGKIWLKLITSTNNPRKYIRKGSDTKIGPGMLVLISNTFKMMNEENHVLFSTTDTIYMLKSIYCSISSEEEIRRIFVFVDRSEKEDLQGLPFSIHCNQKSLFSARMRTFFESGVMYKLDELIGDHRKTGYQLSAASKEHKRQQDLACNDQISAGKHVDVKSIGVNYFMSFLMSILALGIIAKMVLCLEQLKRNAKK